MRGSSCNTNSLSLLIRSRRFQISGNTDAKLRAATFLASDFDQAMMVLHDSVRDGQPKSGTLADRLRRKERVENAIPDRLRDSRSGIPHGDNKRIVCLGRLNNNLSFP